MNIYDTAMPSHTTCHAISCTPISRYMPCHSYAISRHMTRYLTLAYHARCHAISCCHLTPRATPFHARCHTISRHVLRHLMHAILTPVNWRNVAESFWTTVVHCIRYGRFTDRCGTLRCLTVHCATVRKRCGRVAVVDHRSATQCIVVRCICCGRLTHHCGTLQCLTVHCGGLHICYIRLVGHCGALWCVMVQCGNIVEGLRTIAAHCGVLYMLWKAYRLLRYLAVPYNALQCTAETL